MINVATETLIIQFIESTPVNILSNRFLIKNIMPKYCSIAIMERKFVFLNLFND